MSSKSKKKYYNKRKKSAEAYAKNASGSPSAAPPPKKTAAAKKSSPPPSPLIDLEHPIEIGARLFLLAMVVIFPLVMGEQRYGNITHFKNIAYYYIAILSFFFIILLAMIKIIMTRDYRFDAKLLQFTPADVAVLFYWGFLLLSTLLSEYKLISLFGQGVRNDGLIIQTFYVITYFVLSRLIRLHKFDLNLYCWGATIVAVLVMCHYFGWDVMDTGFYQPNWESHLLFLGPMGNINLTSYFVTVALILAASVYITEQQFEGFLAPWNQNGWFTLCCFAMLLWAELNLNTDAGIVAIAAAVAVALPLMMISWERVGRMLTVLAVACGVVIFDRWTIHVNILAEGFGKLGYAALIAGILALALAVNIRMGILKLTPSRQTLLTAALSVDGAALVGGLMAAFIAAKTQTSGVLYELGQMLYHGNFDDRFGSRRLFTWKRTIKLAGKHPLFGSGPDTFCDVFKAAYGEESAAFFNGRNLDKAHNEYLQLLICSGVTGMGAFLAFLGSMVVRAFRRATDNPLLVCCAMAVVGYAVHAFFGYSLPINSPLMWVLFGLTGAAMRVEQAD